MTEIENAERDLNVFRYVSRPTSTHLNVFSQLKLVENAAIPRRREILDIEVKRQRIREQNLQKEYADAKLEHDQMTNNVDEEQMELI
jgi:hypothetical protein